MKLLTEVVVRHKDSNSQAPLWFGTSAAPNRHGVVVTVDRREFRRVCGPVLSRDEDCSALVQSWGRAVL